MRLIVRLALLVFVSTAAPAAESSIIARGAKLEKLADGFAFTEGPACDSQGNVFFTDQPNDRILKWSTDGKLSTFMQPCGRANGLCFDNAGNLWACADEKNELWWIKANGDARIAVLSRYQGKLLNGPNDIWIQPQPSLKAAETAVTLNKMLGARDARGVRGGLYFTDPYYKRPWWKRGEKEMAECVYYLAPDCRNLTRVIDDLKQPNGIIGTPDGRTLYVADIGAGKTYRYSIQSSGSLTNKTLFCELGSDGMTMDSKGNVYLTGHGVTVFDSSGKKIEQVEVPEPWTANVCFGGKDRHTLFITASKGLYGLRMRVKGVGSQ